MISTSLGASNASTLTEFLWPRFPSLDEVMTSLRKLAIRGTVWTVASYGASQILRLASNLILTHLLFPKLFGLIALVYVFITGLHLFSDIGVGPSIIQNKRGDDPVFLNTAWTLQVIRSFGLWFCCLLIAWPVAKFYGEPQFLWLIPIVGLSTIITGFNSTALFTLNRHMALRQLAIFELGGQVISITVMIVWAWLSPSIWALVGGSLVSASIQMLWSHRLIPGSSNRFAWNQDATKDLFSFGRWIFMSTAITFLAEQIDRLMLGKLLSLEMLGVYGIAFTLADMPRQITLALSGKVIFPAVSKLADLPRETVRAKLLHNRKPILIALAFGLSVLVSFGDILISVLYDNRYIQAAWMLPILALGIWPRILCNTIEPSLFAIGKPQYPALGQLLRFLFTFIGLLLGFSLMGVEGAVIAVALNDLVFYGAINYGLWREELSGLMQDIKATALLVALLTVVLTGRFVLGFGLPINRLL
jgi:O-antigen/teichoic acid export membrane protein